MTKTINLEYELKTRSRNTVWTLIGTAIGLNKWIADSVSIEDNELTLIWGNPLREYEERKAIILQSVPCKKIKLQWQDDGAEYITEIKMCQNEIAENYHLLITDEVDEEESEAIIHFWNSKIQQLHRITGL